MVTPYTTTVGSTVVTNNAIAWAEYRILMCLQRAAGGLVDAQYHSSDERGGERMERTFTVLTIPPHSDCIVPFGNRFLPFEVPKGQYCGDHHPTSSVGLERAEHGTGDALARREVKGDGGRASSRVSTAPSRLELPSCDGCTSIIGNCSHSPLASPHPPSARQRYGSQHRRCPASMTPQNRRRLLRPPVARGQTAKSVPETRTNTWQPSHIQSTLHCSSGNRPQPSVGRSTDSLYALIDSFRHKSGPDEVSVDTTGLFIKEKRNRGDALEVTSPLAEVDALLVGGRLWQESKVGSFADLIRGMAGGSAGTKFSACRPVRPNLRITIGGG